MSQNESAMDTGRRVDLSQVQAAPPTKTARRHVVKPAPSKKPQPKREIEKIVVKAPVEIRVEIPAEIHVPLVRPEAKEWDDTGDFAAMLEAAAPVKKLDIEVGSRVRAKVIYISKDTVFFALGQKHEGSMSLGELMGENVKVGDFIDLYVVSIGESIELSKKVGRFADSNMLEDAKNNRIPMEGKITGANTGGVEVSLAGARAFCPVGQLGLHFVEDPSSMIGQTHTFLVTQISNGGRNVVLSRRALLERERGEQARERMSTLAVGDRVEGVVSRTADFGAFVELGGVEGLIPLSELGFGHTLQVSDRVSVGDRVTAEVMRIEANPKRAGEMRISLSLKAAMPDPFEAHRHLLVPGTSLEGTVARLDTFGAFVELFPGLDGLVHISELSEQRVRHPSEVLKVGDPVTVRILEVDFDRRRIALSLRENVERNVLSEITSSLERGTRVDGVVERVERYGVFVKLSTGQSALLPASESGQARGTDLGRVFPIGTNLSLMLIDIDDRGRLRVSKIAREKSEDQELVRQFTATSPKSLGTFADLFSLASVSSPD